MNVLFLTTSFPRRPGDYSGVFVFHLAQGLRALGIDIDVVAPNDGDLEPEAVVGGVRLHRFNFFLNKSRKFIAGGGGIPGNLKNNKLFLAVLPFFLWAFLRKALRHSRRADLVHCQWFPLGILGLVLRLAQKKKYVVNVRGSDKIFLEKKFRFLARAIIRRSGAVVFVGRDLFQKLHLQDKFHLVPNGVDVCVRKDYPRRTGERLVLYAGNLSPNKSVETLVRAAALLQETDAFRVLIVGEGPEKTKLEALVQELGLEGRVRFRGPLPQEELFSLMAQSYVFVQPSFSEGRSNVVLEALASGLPVVASRIPANSEIIEDRKNGLLFEPGNAADLAAGIRFLLEAPGAREGMAEEGKRVIREQGLTWESASRKYVQIYEKVLRAEES